MHMRAILLCCLLNGGFVGSSFPIEEASCLNIYCHQCHVTADIYICSSNPSVTTNTDLLQISESGDSIDTCLKGGKQDKKNYMGNFSSCHENSCKGNFFNSSSIAIYIVFGAIMITVLSMVIYLLQKGPCMKDCAKQSDVTTREEARPIMDIPFRDTLKNDLKEKYPTPLCNWVKDWFKNSGLHGIGNNNDKLDIKKYHDVLQEKFIKERKRVLLNDCLYRHNEIPFCYHYILNEWAEGDFLSNCLVVYKNVSEQDSLQNALKDLREGQLDLALSDACENGHILVLLYGFKDEEYSPVNLEDFLGLTENSNVSVWSTEPIFPKESNPVSLQEKDHSKNESF